MRNNQSTLSLVFIFILLVYVLKLFGIITLSTGKIISYAFLLYGIVSVHLTLGTHRRAGLFLGTSIFLTGVVLFIVEYFDIIQPGVLVLPSLLFIVGIGFLMLFFDDFSNRVFSLHFRSSGFLLLFIGISHKKGSLVRLCRQDCLGTIGLLSGFYYTPWCIFSSEQKALEFPLP